MKQQIVLHIEENELRRLLNNTSNKEKQIEG